MDIARCTTNLILHSMALLVRVLPQNAGVAILDFFVLYAIFEIIPWPYILPPNQSEYFYLFFAFCLACLPASHWLASATFLLSEVEKGFSPSFIGAVRFGFSRIHRTWLILVFAVMLTYVPMFFLVRLPDLEVTGFLLLGITIFCCSLVVFPFFLSSFVLKNGNAIVTEGDIKRPSSVSLLIAAILLFGVGCVPGVGIICCLWRQSGLSDFQVAYLLFVVVFVFPLASQVAFFKQVQVKQFVPARA